MTTLRLALAAMLLALTATGAMGGTGGTVRYEDPVEQQVKAIATELRCPVCQGESIYDSHATVAAQMKALIREQVAAGKSPDEIKSFFVERYGEFVLMQPRASARTALVWVFPVIAFFGGTLLLFMVLRARAASDLQDAAERTDLATQDLINRIERLGP